MKCVSLHSGKKTCCRLTEEWLGISMVEMDLEFTWATAGAGRTLSDNGGPKRKDGGALRCQLS